MSICNGDNEQKLIMIRSKGHNSAENYSTGPKFELNLVKMTGADIWNAKLT